PYEEVLLRLGAVLEQRGHEHARSLPHDLERRPRTLELLGDDRRLQRIGRLLRAAVATRHVPGEVAMLDRRLAERGRAVVGANRRARHGGDAVGLRSGGGVLGGPVGREEAAHPLAVSFVLCAVAEVHGWLLAWFGRTGLLTRGGVAITSR